MEYNKPFLFATSSASERTNERAGEWIWTNERNKQTNKRASKRLNERVSKQTNEWTNKRTNERMRWTNVWASELANKDRERVGTIGYWIKVPFFTWPISLSFALVRSRCSSLRLARVCVCVRVCARNVYIHIIIYIYIILPDDDVGCGQMFSLKTH